MNKYRNKDLKDGRMKTIVSFSAAIITLGICVSSCQKGMSNTDSGATDAIALINSTLIDGNGGSPIQNSVILIEGGAIKDVGVSGEIIIPSDYKIYDLEGAYVLPGFINAHVHDSFDAEKIKQWACNGVTTVRDECLLDKFPTSKYISLKNNELNKPENASIISAGHMFSAPYGYGRIYVTSSEDAVKKVNQEIDAGVDLIKISLEDGYADFSNLPKLSSAEFDSIIQTAHKRGKKVTAHITQGKYMKVMVEKGVDDIAHCPYDYVEKETFQKMIEQNIYLVSTLTVLDAFGVPENQSNNNLKTFIDMGGMVALGNDYSEIPQNNFPHFEIGMPMYEIKRMASAGMSPIQIIIASTRNAAHVCGIDKTTGTVEPGKQADILVLKGNPLDDLDFLKEIKMVIHRGIIIRE